MTSFVEFFGLRLLLGHPRFLSQLPLADCQSAADGRLQLNGKAFDNRSRSLGRWSPIGEGHLFSAAIRFSPVGDQLVSGSGLMGSGPNVVGSDPQNCGEGAATPPLQSRRGRLGAGHHRRSFGADITSRAVDLTIALPRKRTGRSADAGRGTTIGAS